MITITSSKLRNQELCTEYSFSGNKESERGAIIHAMISTGERPNCKTYKGQIEFFAYVHDYDSYDEVVNRTTQHLVPLKSFVMEKELNFKEGEVEIQGILDLLSIDGGKALVIDWKTGSSHWYDTQDYMSIIQSIVYSFLVFMNFEGVNKVTFKYVFLDEFVRGQGCTEISLDFERSYFEQGDFLEVIQSLMKGTSARKTGNFCATCRKFFECEAIKQRVLVEQGNLEIMKNSDLFLKSDKEYSELSSLSKFLEKRLETYKDMRKDEEMNNPEFWKERKMSYQFIDITKLDNKEKDDLLSILAKETLIKLNKQEALFFDKAKIITKSSVQKLFKLGE